MKKIIQYFSSKNERGVTLALVALLLFVFLGVGALVVDLGLLYAARNELQNAADAGALAGARVLYSEDGTTVNSTDAITKAGTAAVANFSHGSEVEVKEGDVQIGHWSFGLGDLPRGFTPANSFTPIIIANYNEIELDQNPDFINAVKVIARRDSTPVSAFFSKIFDITGLTSFADGFKLNAEAVGYIGYAGNVDIDEIDYPIMPCKDSAVTKDSDGRVECNIGKVLSSEKTAMWTNYEQDSCGTASASSVNNVMTPCGTRNKKQIYFGEGISTTNGVQGGNVRTLQDCWRNANLEKQDLKKNPGTEEYFPAEPWTIKLLLADCDNMISNNCVPIAGVVTVKVLWISTSDTSKYAPMKMKGIPSSDIGDWENMDSDDKTRWNDFVDHFKLQDENGDPPYVDKGKDPRNAPNVFMFKDCEIAEPTGGTGGENYGVMARIPVLVR